MRWLRTLGLTQVPEPMLVVVGQSGVAWVSPPEPLLTSRDQPGLHKLLAYWLSQWTSAYDNIVRVRRRRGFADAPTWLIIGVLVGGVLGWLTGSWTSCASSSACELRVNSVEALGTWVGGLGTVGALLYAAREFSQRNSRGREAGLVEARRSSIKLRGVDGPNADLRLHMEVTNRAATDLLDVRFVIDRGGDEREVARQSQVHPGRTFGGKVSLADIGVAGLPQDKRDAAAIINGLRPRVTCV